MTHSILLIRAFHPPRALHNSLSLDTLACDAPRLV